MSDQLPLHGVRVLELGHIVAGPSASLILADLGADVIKVENPRGGDAARSTPNQGTAFFAYNRNKRSIALDLKAPRGVKVFLDLVRGADIVIDNYAPGVLERLGVGYERGAAVNPRVIYLSVRGFLPGPYGSRPLLDEVAQMMGGLAYMTGPVGQPLRAGASVVDIGAATYGVVAALAALYVRERTGRGQRIVAGLFETSVFWMAQHIALAGLTGEHPPPMPARGMGGRWGWAIYRLFDTADARKVFVAVTSDAHWDRFCREFDLEDLRTDPRLASNALRVEAQPWLLPRIEQTLGAFTLAEAIERLERAGVPYAPVNTPLDLLSDPHLLARDQVPAATMPTGIELRLPLLPVESSEYRPRTVIGPPRLGQHTRAVLAEAGYSEREIEALLREGVVAEEPPPAPGAVP